eukprot:3004466-Pyramimonas_sp.AAC.1
MPLAHRRASVAGVPDILPIEVGNAIVLQPAERHDDIPAYVISKCLPFSRECGILARMQVTG